QHFRTGSVPDQSASDVRQVHRGAAGAADSVGGEGHLLKSVRDLFDLSGRAAIVTGGSRGLGFEIAEGLAEAGASLMLCARREQWLTPAIDALRRRGFQADGRVCDVSNPQQVEEVVAAAGKVDILVNNAGISWGEEP